MQEHMELTKSFNFNSSMIAENEPTDVMEESVDDEGVSSFAQFGLEDGSKVFCGGIVSKIKRIVKDNKTMAIVDVEDLYGTFPIMIFAKNYEKIRNSLAEDKIITVNGRLSIRVGQSPIIVSETISFVGEEPEQDYTYVAPKQKIVVGEEKAVSNKTIYLQFDINNEKIRRVVQDILLSYAGTAPVKVQWERKLYPINIKAEPCLALESELKVLLGDNNVKIL